MSNIILEQNLCRVIAQAHALNFNELWKVYTEVNSFDKLLQMIQNKEVK